MRTRFTIRLSDSQLEKLADIAADTGLISLASVVLPAILERFVFWNVVVGIACTFFLWSISLWFLKIKSIKPQ